MGNWDKLWPIRGWNQDPKEALVLLTVLLKLRDYLVQHRYDIGQTFTHPHFKPHQQKIRLFMVDIQCIWLAHLIRFYSLSYLFHRDIWYVKNNISHSVQCNVSSVQAGGESALFLLSLLTSCLETQFFISIEGHHSPQRIQRLVWMTYRHCALYAVLVFMPLMHHWTLKWKNTL